MLLHDPAVPSAIVPRLGTPHMQNVVITLQLHIKPRCMLIDH